MISGQKLIVCICSILADVKLGSCFVNNPLHPAKLRQPKILYSDLQVTSINTTLVPPGILGPPDTLKAIEVGQHVRAFRNLQYAKDADTDKIQEFTIQRISSSPDIFCLRNFLTPSECNQIKSTAKASGMKQAETVTDDDASSRKNCSVAWLSSDGQYSSISSSLVAATANIFLSEHVTSHPTAGVEDLQVLRYGTGGEFVHHHDGEPRILTVIYYLNGVGSTWFPLSRACTENESTPANKAQVLDLVKDFQPGKNGVLIKGVTGNAPRNSTNTANREENEHIVHVNPGDAIAFYNYLDDGSGRLDWRAIHCGLPTTEEEGTKWIANHWYTLHALAEM